MKSHFALLAFLCLTGCLASSSPQPGSPAGISAENRTAERNATDTIIASAADAPAGGVVSAPVDVEGWDPGGKGDAADLPNATPNTDDPVVYNLNAQKAPTPLPPPSAANSNQPKKLEASLTCDQTHYVRLVWMADFRKFLGLDVKGTHDYFLSEMNPKLMEQTEISIKYLKRREDLCAPESAEPQKLFPNLMASANGMDRWSSAVVFQTSSPPPFEMSEPPFSTQESFQKFLGESEAVDYWTPPPLKIPGK